MTALCPACHKARLLDELDKALQEYALASIDYARSSSNRAYTRFTVAHEIIQGLFGKLNELNSKPSFHVTVKIGGKEYTYEEWMEKYRHEP